jgi:trk system potassium uptake protein TrkH
MALSPVLLATGVMLALMGLAMLPCALISVLDGRDSGGVFAVWAFVCMAVGLVLGVSAGSSRPRTGMREAFLLTVLVWVVLCVAGALPFFDLGISPAQAIFEAVSGLTTTGATIFSGLDGMDRGILLWRAILQWIGGIGVIVTAIAILPVLQVGGMQLFSVESSDRTGKFMPRVGEIASQIGLVYLVITLACTVAFRLGGMGGFNAITHAMATVSAGGFSTHDASLGQYNGTPVIGIAIPFMIIAAFPFSLLALAILQGRPAALLRDPQPRLFVLIWLGVSALMLAFHAFGPSEIAPEARESVVVDTLFNVASVMSGTGFATAPYDTWGGFAAGVFFLLTFLGGCAGSASCGIKMFRLEIGLKATLAYTARMVSPNRTVPVMYDNRPVSEATLQSVMVFITLFLATFTASTLALNLLGLDFETAVTAAAATISNVGPGLGPLVGPSTNFGNLDDAALWVCTITMLLGRLEFVAVFVVLSWRFWRG